MLEFLLTNHPLDCPVCDKGGECELQDMAFRYGAGESRFKEEKVHTPEKQFSPVVYFDAPRCILCFRCVRICNEGMGVGALGVINRGVYSEIAPNKGRPPGVRRVRRLHRYLPGGRALTSGIYRYQTRPWEMTHVGTICTHCGGWLQDHARHTATTKILSAATIATRSGVNGRIPLHQGPLRASISTITPERHAVPAGPQERQARGSLLERGARQLVAARSSTETKVVADKGSVRCDRLPTTPPTKRISTCANSRGRCWARRTSTTIAPAM